MEKEIVMGCYGIGVGRTVAAAIEQYYDENGIIFPMPIAPFQVHLTVVNVRDARMAEIAEGLYRELGQAGLEVLYDDRDERPGVKFKDADLLGMPVRVTVGAKALKEGVVEVRRRKSGEVTAVSPAECVAAVRRLLGAA